MGDLLQADRILWVVAAYAAIMTLVRLLQKRRDALVEDLQRQVQEHQEQQLEQERLERKRKRRERARARRAA